MKFNVIIHTKGEPPMPLIFNEKDQYIGVVHLSYHMGERWGSVRRGDDPLKVK